MMAFAPLNALTGAWMSRMASTRTQVEQEKYAVAGAIAEETFSSIRTVHSLNGATREIARWICMTNDFIDLLIGEGL